MPIVIGTSLGPYQILAPLGSGGMGEVYRALDTRLQRTVAIKVLPREKLRDSESRRRFLQEAQAASALNHPNIVTLHDIASDGDVDFLVMEYVPGEALSRLIDGKALPLPDLLAYASQMASALAKAHAAGIVHRDIKPANVIITPERQVKILDFGLAKLEEPAAGENDETRMRRADLTKPGMVMGTVPYMSPEQARGEPVDARADLFSLGAVLYEMAGRRAFPKALDWTRPAAPTTREDVNRIILKLLEPDRENRYQTASDVVSDLERVRASHLSGVSRRSWLWASGLAALVIAGVWTGLEWHRNRPSSDTLRLSDGNRASRNAEANSYYEKALLFGGAGVEDNGQRLRLLERALGLDPKFAAARAEYAFAHLVTLLQGDSNDPAVFYETEELVRQALRDDPGCGRAHSVLGLTYLLQGRKELVPAELDAALRANPEDLTAVTWRLEYDRFNGDYPEATRIAKELIARWPLYWPGHLYLAELLQEQADTVGAIKEAEAGLEQDPKNLASLITLGRIYLDRAELAKARETLERARAVGSRNYQLRLAWALLLASEGMRTEATETMDADTQTFAALMPTFVLLGAEVHAVMGDAPTALEWVGKAVRAGDDRESWMRRDPQLASIRAHPDFHKMLDSIAFRRQQRSPRVAR